MKILKRLLNCNGKLAISTAQKIGLTAAVGVAGLAAGQMFLSGPKTSQDTVFSAQNEPEIVYVGGGSTAGDVREFGAREADVGVLYAQRADKRHSFDFGQEEVGDFSANRPDFQQQEQGIEAYKMDGQYEAGIVANTRAKEKSGSMSDGAFDMNGQMGDIQDKISQVMNQAQEAQAAAQAQATQGEGGVGVAAADVQQAAGQILADAVSNSTGKFGMAAGIARANGSFSSTPLQAGRPGSQRSGVLNNEGGNANGSEKENALGITEISPRYAGGRQAVIGAGQRFRDLGDTLEGIRNRSADVAGSRSRSSVEAAKSFLDSEKLSGGVRTGGIMLSSLEGQGTQAYISEQSMPEGAFSSFGPTPSGLNNGMGEVDAEMEAFISARQALEDRVHDFVDHANRISWYFCWMPPSITKEALTLAHLAKDYLDTKDQIERFQENWADFEGQDGEEGKKSYSEQLRERLNWSYFQDALWPGTPKKQWKKWKDSQKEEGGTANEADSSGQSSSGSETKERSDSRSSNGGAGVGGRRTSPYGRRVVDSSLNLE